MIFSNDGQTQVQGNPLQVTEDLANVVTTIRKHLMLNGGNERDADRIISFAGRLSALSDEERAAFYETLPQNVPLSIMDIVDEYDNYLERSAQAHCFSGG